MNFSNNANDRSNDSPLPSTNQTPQLRSNLGKLDPCPGSSAESTPTVNPPLSAKSKTCPRSANIIQLNDALPQTPSFKLIPPDLSAFYTTGYLKKSMKQSAMPTPSTPSKKSTTKFLVPLIKTPFPSSKTEAELGHSASATSKPHLLESSHSDKGHSMHGTLSAKHVPDSPMFAASGNEFGKKIKNDDKEEEQFLLDNQEEDNLFFSPSPTSNNNSSKSNCASLFLNAKNLFAVDRLVDVFPKQSSSFSSSGSGLTNLNDSIAVSEPPAICSHATTSSPYKSLRNKFECLNSTIGPEKLHPIPNEQDKSPLTGHHIPDNLDTGSESNSHYDTISSRSSDSEGCESLFSSVRLPVGMIDKICPWKSSHVNFLTKEYFQLNGENGNVHAGSMLSGLFPEGNYSKLYHNVGNYFESNYDIIDLLGHGSFANVYKVVRKSDNAVFAVKKSRSSFSGMADRRRKLIEVQNMWTLRDHPNISRIEESWEQDGYLYLVLELCENGTLRDFFHKDASFSWEQLWFIAEQIACGIMYMHSNGIIHLDLKPENILFTDDYALKLSDFGLSRNITEAEVGYSQADDCEGDKIYMAPEVLQGQIGRPADIFSFGLILLELVANIELPSQGESWQMLRNEDFSLISFDGETPVQIVDLVKGMLRSPPNERLRIEQVLQTLQTSQLG